MKLAIIENTKEARGAYGRRYRSEAKITKEQLAGLLQGQCLALDSEDQYVCFLTLKNDREEAVESVAAAVAELKEELESLR